MGVRGKKSNWHSAETKTIRVPVRFAEVLMSFAIALDEAVFLDESLTDVEWKFLTAAEYSDLEKRAARGDRKRKPKGFQ